MSAPIKLTFGNAKANKPVLARKTVAAFASNDTHESSRNDEFISGVDGNKITSLVPKEEPKLLVIPKQENADWRSKSLEKRKKQYMPEESLRTPMEIIEEPVKEVGYGLQITKRTKIEHVSQEESAPELVVEQVTIEETTVTEKEETIEELAARKIIEDLNGHDGTEARKLVLEGQENIHADDVEAFQKNLEELPNEATLEDYEKVPVEEFGAALLRGMGWNGDAKGSEAIEFNRRPALLGLGARPKEPEPITKKYIKPGESRTPQPISVPTSHTTGRSNASSSRDRDSRREYSRDQDRYKDDRESRRESSNSSRRHDDRFSRRDDREDRDRRRDEPSDRSRRNDGRDDRDKSRSSRSERDSERDRDRTRRDRDYRDDRDRDSRRDRDRDDHGRR
ncbi:hypothetical protein MVEG_11598 [Podila verticillata NRRL 6337]|uniref:Spp2/MOS2 G-patch domain-containing protein n=1 Tax=Podila verticillata NRRL 6337 TaxID=1069443 RepID=A0A086TKB2_9FUNG|nr:hypothetical protein MVEG_11598 [Podila verticillata NRRL 6337]